MGAVDGRGSRSETGKTVVGSLWNVGVVERSWGIGGALLGPMGLSSSCLNLYHCMVIEELGSSPRHMAKFPRFFLHSNVNFSEESKMFQSLGWGIHCYMYDMYSVFTPN